MFRGFRRSLRIFFFFSRSVCFFPPFFSDCRSHQSVRGKETHLQPLLCPVPSSASGHPLCLTLQEYTRSSRRCWQHCTRHSPQTPIPVPVVRPDPQLLQPLGQDRTFCM